MVFWKATFFLNTSTTTGSYETCSVIIKTTHVDVKQHVFITNMSSGGSGPLCSVKLEYNEQQGCVCFIDGVVLEKQLVQIDMADSQI